MVYGETLGLIPKNGHKSVSAVLPLEIVLHLLVLNCIALLSDVVHLWLRLSGSCKHRLRMDLHSALFLCGVARLYLCQSEWGMRDSRFLDLVKRVAELCNASLFFHVQLPLPEIRPMKH